MSANTFLPPSPVAPMFLLISAVTNANPMQVTVTTPNQYVVGQLAYFSIPVDYGMFQLNALTGQILTVDPTNLIFTVSIDSTQFDQFVIPSGGEQPASMSPSGARNIYNNTTVPFHAINGMVGN
jgi:hypothetical protein